MKQLRGNDDYDMGDTEMTVLLFELKADLNAYLASLGPSARVKTLKDIIEFKFNNRLCIA